MNAPVSCHSIVTRDGHEEPCDKPAAGMRTDPEGGPPWPACPWHLNQAGEGNYVPLSDLLADALVAGVKAVRAVGA